MLQLHTPTPYYAEYPRLPQSLQWLQDPFGEGPALPSYKCAFIHSHQIAHLRLVNVILCKLYFKELIFKNFPKKKNKRQSVFHEGEGNLQEMQPHASPYFLKR